MARIPNPQDPDLQDVVQRDIYEANQGLRVGNVLVDTNIPKRGQVLAYNDLNQSWELRGGIDTPRPKLVWESTSTISLEYAPGFTRCLLTLQDGKQRQWTDDGAVSLPTYIDYGSEANSTWYYIYLIPNPNDDRQLVPVFSINDPSEGPSKGGIYCYCGAVYNNASGNIKKFYQLGSRFSYDQFYQVTDLGTSTVTGSNVSFLSFIPLSASIAFGEIEFIKASGAGGNIRFYIDGDATEFMLWQFSHNFLWGQYYVPMPTSLKRVQVTTGSFGGGSITRQLIRCNGWFDEYLGWSSHAQ